MKKPLVFLLNSMIVIVLGACSVLAPVGFKCGGRFTISEP